MPRHLRLLLATTLLSPLVHSAAAQAVPDALRLQARIASASGTALDGPVSLELRLYDAPSAGLLLWSESVATTALAGVVSVPLGEGSPFPAGLFDGGARWLGLAVNGDLELSPRVRLAAVPYAARAQSALALDASAVLPAGSVGGAQVLDGSLGAAELAPGAVGSSALAIKAVNGSHVDVGAIASLHLADASVTGAKLAAGAVGPAALSTEAVTAAAIAAGAVGTSEIADGAITAADIATGAVGAAEIGTGAVGAAEVQDGSIGALELAPGAVGSAALAAASVGATQLAAGAVSASKIASGAVSAAHVADGSLGSAELATGAVEGIDVLDGTIRAEDLASDPDSLAKVSFGALAMSGTSAVLGGGAADGKLNVRHASGTSSAQLTLTDTVAGGYARLTVANDNAPSAWTLAGKLTGTPADERLNLFHSGAGDVLSLTGDGLVGINTTAPAADLHVKGKGSTGKLSLSPSGGDLHSELLLAENSGATIGMRWRYDGAANQLQLQGVNGATVYGPHITVERNSGDVAFGGNVAVAALEVTGGADLVEAFWAAGDCAPGTVMVIAGAEGGLAPSAAPYDRRVAGVVSGAGGVRPGLALRQAGVLEGNAEVAMAGRVYVRCTAENGPIEPGDLLTSSSTAGCAMRASDPARAFGAVIGKALGALAADEGLVLVLVNLQ